MNPAAAEVCHSGVDEDCDGLADCEDGDCPAFCFEADCADTLDEDGDGTADCADDDCWGRAPCGTTTVRLHSALVEQVSTSWGGGFDIHSATGSVSFDRSGSTVQCTWQVPFVHFALDAYAWVRPYDDSVRRSFQMSSACPVQDHAFLPDHFSQSHTSVGWFWDARGQSAPLPSPHPWYRQVWTYTGSSSGGLPTFVQYRGVVTQTRTATGSW